MKRIIVFLVILSGISLDLVGCVGTDVRDSLKSISSGVDSIKVRSETEYEYRTVYLSGIGGQARSIYVIRNDLALESDQLPDIPLLLFDASRFIQDEFGEDWEIVNAFPLGDSFFHIGVLIRRPVEE
ncbi:MAG: hypothetical protein NUW37_10745 [Planctomycetes bacterium]|nr:hypothetical protein [Planctomycetota bacterium]